MPDGQKLATQYRAIRSRYMQNAGSQEGQRLRALIFPRVRRQKISALL